jgi:signal transduction histidine kinase
MRRLYFRIYLAVLGSLALFAVLVGLSGWVFHELREPDNTGPHSPFLPEVAEHLLPAAMPPATLGQELEFWHNRTKFDLALVSAAGEVISRAGPIPDRIIARYAGSTGTQGVHWHPHGIFTVGLSDGRLLIAASPPNPSGYLFPLRWLGLVFAIGLAVAIATYPLVRRLTRNLEQLQKGVAAFGQGNLKARVAVRGRDEVGKLAQTFNASADRIEALLTGQKRLLANASHELRSPLARLRMAAEAIGASAPEQERQEIARNIAELDGLVDEILLASRLDAGAAGTDARERIDLIGVLAEECAPFDAILTVVPGQSVFVEGDVRLMHRLFRNLLENARRHGGEGDIDVSAACRSSHAVVTVCDRGPGIPESERSRIFEPFCRLPGHSEHAGGTGLGLALVRQIAEKYRGEVQYVAREGGGACFEVMLPLVRPHAAADAALRPA